MGEWGVRNSGAAIQKGGVIQGLMERSRECLEKTVFVDRCTYVYYPAKVG